MDILLSIKPKYADMILSGAKTIELRKKWATKPIGRVWMHATDYVGGIVGYFTPGEILISTPEEIWKNLGPKACVFYLDYQDYFKNSKQAVAIGVGNPKRLESPIETTKPIPQSWRYIKEKEIGILEGYL